MDGGTNRRTRTDRQSDGRKKSEEVTSRLKTHLLPVLTQPTKSLFAYTAVEAFRVRAQEREREREKERERERKRQTNRHREREREREREKEREKERER